MPSFYELMGVPQSGFDRDHMFETSWLFRPFVLACIRLAIAIYCLVTLIVGYVWDGIHLQSDILIAKSLSFFTELTFYGITCYFVVAATHTFVYARRGKAWLDLWPRPVQALHSLYYTTIVTYPFLVTIVFWAVLYKGPWYTQLYDGWSNVSKHMLNSVFALFELIFTTTQPLPWLHLALSLLILLLYLGLAYLTYAVQGWYVYPFLNPNGKGGRAMVVAYIAGICVGAIIIFVISRYVIWARKKITRAGKKSGMDAGTYSPYVQHIDVEMRPKD